MPAVTSLPRTANVTSQPHEARNKAACPAELAPPTTVMAWPEHNWALHHD
ncbi:hypothetical protein [Actinacidiphila rubida]|nr:hypothetical protein [Actinacidiphila rubida]